MTIIRVGDFNRRLASASTAVGLLGALVVPAVASPRITAHWEQVTLHEALLRLRHEYVGPVVTSEGAERDDYPDPTGARRATFDWHDAPLERVLLDLGSAFGNVPRTAGTDGVRFEPGRPSDSGIAVSREGLQIGLASVEQEVEASRAPGRPADSRRSLILNLTVRTSEGAPERFYGVEHLRARDNLGREIRLPQLEPLRPAAAGTGGIVGESLLRAELPGAGAGAASLATIDGDALVYQQVRYQRIEMPLTERRPDRQVGAVRLTGISTFEKNGGVTGAFFFAWPKSVEVGERGARSPLFPAAARLADGRLIPLSGRIPELLVDENGNRSGKMELHGDQLPGTPVALVVDVLQKELPLERVPFRFTAVPLPLPDGAGKSSRAPAKGPGELLVALTSVRELRGALSVGLSRREVSGWSAFRWTALETDGQGEARISGIAPGSYRVRISFRPRVRAGDTRAAVPLQVPEGGLVRMVPGREIRIECRP